MNTTSEKCIEACNALLRGELAAEETYRQAHEKFAGHPPADTLLNLLATHGAHTSIIREHVIAMGGEPSRDSGIWGVFAKTVEGTAKLLGKSATLQALIEGEKQGIRSYEAALKGDDLEESIKTVYRSEVIPALHQNVAVLEELQNTV